LLAQLSEPGLEAILSGDDVGNGIQVNPQSIVRFEAPADDDEDESAIQDDVNDLDVTAAPKAKRRKVQTCYDDNV
jgi:hypothetical protein